VWVLIVMLIVNRRADLTLTPQVTGH
jgi:hypothetical protein